MTSPLKVWISVLNWNTSGATLACVRALCAQPSLPGVAVDVRVTDNGSAAADFDRLRDGLPAHVALHRQQDNLGFAGGHNLALRAALSEGVDFVWLFNSDAVLTDSATLSTLLGIMRAHPHCGAASPMLADADGTLYFRGGFHDWARLKATWPPFDESKRLQKTRPHDCWVSGAALLLRVDALREVGLLNEHYFAYYEDNELSARLAAAGWQNRIAFDRVVQHPMTRDDLERKPYYFYLMQRNALSFWFDQTPAPHRRFLRLRLLDLAFFQCNRLYRDGFREKADAALLGIHDFWAGNTGAPRLDRPLPRGVSFVRKLFALQQRRALERETAH